MAKKAAARRPSPSAVVAKALSPVQDFIRTESASGVILIAAAALAFAWANSPWAASYFAILDIRLAVSFGAWSLDKPLLLWVNDLLMALFFFVIGLGVVIGAQLNAAMAEPPEPTVQEAKQEVAAEVAVAKAEGEPE